MKRMLSMLLCLVLCLALLPAAFAEGGAAPNDMFGDDGTLHWYLDSAGTLTLKDSTGEVTGRGACPADQVIRVVFDAGTTRIGGSVLADCKNLVEVSMPYGVKSLGGWLFENCSKLKTVEIPATVTSIDPACFAKATGLTDIKVDSANTKYKDVGGVLFSKDGKTLWAVPYGKGTTYTVPDGVTKIESAFRNNKKLTSVTMSDTVVSMGASFTGCSALTSVRLSKNLKTVGGYAFAYCTSLEGVTLPDSVTKIEGSAFAYCTALTGIVIPGSVKTIEYDAFSNTALRSVTIPAGVTSLGRSVFDDCNNMREIILWCDSSALAYDTLWGVTTTVYYPADNASWTPEVLSQMKEYFPKITWSPLRKLNISKQPSSVTASAGETVNFTVEAEGAESYQWYFRKSSSDSWSKCSGTGATAATLTVEAKSYRNGYQYRCQLKNVLGSLYTKTATLSVKPAITTQPKSQTAAEGATVKFTVAASGSGLSYQWYFRKSSSDSWSKSSGTGATTASLSVEVKSYRNGYQYRCKVTNAGGYVYSNAATLTVAAKPVITTQPKDQTAAVGATATFTIAATGAESYQWQFRSSSSATWSNSSAASAKTASFSVTAESYRDGYQYRCKVTNAAGTTISNTVTLTVLAKPTITTQPKDQTAAVGETVSFTVKASGADSYQWYFRKSSTDSWSKCSGTGATTATLSVEAKAYRNGYQYRCLVKNAGGQVYSDAATLTVS